MANKGKLEDVMKYYDDMLVTDANSPIEKGKPMYNIIDLWRFAEAYHSAKMAEVTDLDIEARASDIANSESKLAFGRGEWLRFKEGAKAFRAGKIKHKEG